MPKQLAMKNDILVELNTTIGLTFPVNGGQKTIKKEDFSTPPTNKESTLYFIVEKRVFLIL